MLNQESKRNTVTATSFTACPNDFFLCVIFSHHFSCLVLGGKKVGAKPSEDG